MCKTSSRICQFLLYSAFSSTGKSDLGLISWIKHLKILYVAYRMAILLSPSFSMLSSIRQFRFVCFPILGIDASSCIIFNILKTVLKLFSWRSCFTNRTNADIYYIRCSNYRFIFTIIFSISTIALTRSRQLRSLTFVIVSLGINPNTSPSGDSI